MTNIDAVRHVSRRLTDNGFVHTYDWTTNDRAVTIEDLREIGIKEKQAVINADFLVVLLPAGKGSHIEFGLALGQGKTIYLYSPDDLIDNFETTSTFYHLSNVEKCTGSIDELIDTITVKQLLVT
ncbi:hypothetical protein NCCP2716_11540 [Sporosarcina sp. NCCP-2716]|uniref:group-specific protein n=1 Tax=Sporosarcina sp. NCCP-2716 TaxID=2943679 RepID=UPI00207DEBD1|nr:group-specific protein [Sporosarcina sp. NCCP-2716]GKV68656.1 hypothetical protein NCCP2716_11540 [Sporosarcina sp. NCCP-2716]